MVHEWKFIDIFYLIAETTFSKHSKTTEMVYKMFKCAMARVIYYTFYTLKESIH